MDEYVKDNTPRMGPAMHAVCTLLGVCFTALTCYLAYQLFHHFGWGLLAGTLTSFFFAAEFFRGAFTNRYPGWILVLLITP